MNLTLRESTENKVKKFDNKKLKNKIKLKGDTYVKRRIYKKTR